MIKIVFDCLRAPYDWANILQTVIAIGGCELIVTGNSISHDHPKVLGKLGSWSKSIRENGLPDLSIKYYKSFTDCVKMLKSENNLVIGTSPRAKRSFFECNWENSNKVIVFGTESGGLSKEKTSLMDDLVKIPMSNILDFMTLSVVTPIVIYEIKRQQGGM